MRFLGEFSTFWVVDKFGLVLGAVLRYSILVEENVVFGLGG